MKSLDAATTLTSKEKRILSICRDAIRLIDATAEVVLYGSRARGDAVLDSDFDLLILTDYPMNLKQEERYRDVIYPVELETGAVLTLIAHNRQEWNSSLFRAIPFHQNVENDGVIL